MQACKGNYRFKDFKIKTNTVFVDANCLLLTTVLHCRISSFQCSWGCDRRWRYVEWKTL